MKKQTSKIYILVLILGVILCMLILRLALGEPAVGGSGTCGDGLTYTLDAQGKLTISGTGAMDANAFGADSRIVSVEIPDGITAIGEGAFWSCGNLTDVHYAGSAEGWNAIAMGSDNEALTDAKMHFAIGRRPTTAVEMEISPYRRNGDFTAPAKNGYVFTGWYEDADMITPLGENITTGKAYARFVDEDVLSIKWQISSGTNANSEKTDLRVLTTVDELTYSQVGFTLEVEGKPKKEVTSTTVYRTIHGDSDASHQPDIFSPDSEYFMAHTLTGIPRSDFEKEIKVTPNWVTLDGTSVNGKPLTFRICEAEGF